MPEHRNNLGYIKVDVRSGFMLGVKVEKQLDFEKLHEVQYREF